LSRTVTDQELAALVQRITEAAQALISGDIEGYATRIKHAHDYTLMSPYGGDPVKGFDDSDGALDALAQFFRGGEAKVEVVETYTSGDLAVLVVIERQHGTIGGSPEAGLVTARDVGLPAHRRIGLGTRPSSCGRAGAWHRPRAVGRTSARRVTAADGDKDNSVVTGATIGSDPVRALVANWAAGF
jgi:hypothetical protein